MSPNGSVLRLLQWQWKNVLLFVVLATIPTVLHEVFDLSWIVLPTTPLAVFGAALGIFVSFRTNSCYDRWWEGRKLWGRMINTSRHIAMQTARYLDHETAERVIRRHIGYVHSLRVLLRQQSLKDDAILQDYLDDETRHILVSTSNATNVFLDAQMKTFAALEKDGKIDAFKLQNFDLSVRHLLDIQGGCERIKKTPLPRGYGFISSRMIQWFAAGLPFALAGDLGWFTIPVSATVCLGFLLISETGRVLDDPFTMFWNGLPLSSMSRTIERNLLEILGEEELPEPQAQNPPGILM